MTDDEKTAADHEEAIQRAKARLEKRYPSHARPATPPAEILPTDSREVRKAKKRFPSHYQR
jgi:hypothetical protein